jgi:hypothetical protein
VKEYNELPSTTINTEQRKPSRQASRQSHWVGRSPPIGADRAQKDPIPTRALFLDSLQGTVVKHVKYDCPQSKLPVP